MSAVSIAQAAPSEIHEDDEPGAPASGGGGAGRTVWSAKLAGFGLRTYPSGKQAYHYFGRLWVSHALQRGHRCGMGVES